MHMLHKHLVVFSLSLIAGSGLFLRATPVGAATPTARVACDQCETPDRFVRLQQVSEESRSVPRRPFTHPFVLSPTEWTALLKGLQVQRQAEGLLFRDPPGPVLPAFTPEDIEYLSLTLSQAFEQAQPQEMVVFGFSRLNAYNMTEITTGGWYVDGPSLHLVLANYRKAVTMPSTKQLLWELPLRPDAGPHYDLVAGRHQTHVRDTGGWSGLFSTAPSELKLAYQAMLVEGSVGLSPPLESSTLNPGITSPSPSLEDRLRVLKRLHDQGLITEDDYRAKKQQLLDQF